MSGLPQPPSDETPDAHVHDRRYKLFAIGLAAIVLAFAAISITVVVLTAGG